MEAMIDLFLGLERMSPGSSETTAKGWKIASQGHAIEKIVEFGCGSGVSTMELAKLSGAKMIAVDNCEPFLVQLQQKVDQAGLGKQVQLQTQSMDADWPEATQFDLIWGEGSAYAIGVENALRQWRKLLPLGGRIALSDLVWIDPNPDTEVQQYWKEQGATLRYQEETRALFHANGFTILDDFVFADRDWQNYYQPLKAYLPQWKSAYSDAENAELVAQMLLEEIEMYERFGTQYGYAFFIAEHTG